MAKATSLARGLPKGLSGPLAGATGSGFVLDPEGLIAYYRLEDALAGSSVAEATGLGFAFPSTPAYVTSGVGIASNCAYIAMPATTDNAGIVATSAASNTLKQRVNYQGVSMQFWFYMNALPAAVTTNIGVGMTNFSVTNVGSISTGLSITSGGTWTIFFTVGRGGSNYTNAATPAFSVGTWYHIVGVADPFLATNNMTVYVNNVATTVTQAGLFGQFGTRVNSANSFEYELLATRNGSQEALNYRIEEVGIWNRALSASQVSFLYNSGAGRAYSEITF